MAAHPRRPYASPLSDDELCLPVLYHLTMPPCVPHKEAGNLDRIGSILIGRLRDAAHTFSQHNNSPSGDVWAGVYESLNACRDLNQDGRLTMGSLLPAFRNLGHGILLILHVTAQNAAITIRRTKGEELEDVIIEAFETSPQPEPVLAAEALKWSFPAFTARVPYNSFQHPNFQKELASFLETASIESIKRFATLSDDGKSNTYESRNTVDPALIMQVLMPLLAANGSIVIAPLLQKRVRDEVCWNDGSEKPWRRCPIWLVLRVALQRHLMATLGVESGRCQYKICITLLLARFLKKALTSIPPEHAELLFTLKAKVCRRLAKIESDKEILLANIHASHESLFGALDVEFRKTIESANTILHEKWTRYKAGTLRQILELPRYAGAVKSAGADPEQLSLNNSLGYLQQILRAASVRNTSITEYSSTKLPSNFDPDAATTKPSKMFAQKLLELATAEEGLKKGQRLPDHSPELCHIQCVGYADVIEEYIALVGQTYKDSPEQKSTILLLIMEMWVCMDRCATELYPLLKQYDPMFQPNIFEHLRCSEMKDMIRVHNIQKYLQERHRLCELSAKTIFNDPGKGCFGERYYQEGPDLARLKARHQSILDDAESNREKKRLEWIRKMDEHRDLKKRLAAATCEDTATLSPGQMHNRNLCSRCRLDDRLKNYKEKILVHEHPLPADEYQARTVVFELCCPATFARYRGATWKIISTLAYPRPLPGAEVKEYLEDYSQLQGYKEERSKSENSSKPSQLTLGSIPKSYTSAHWYNVPIPTDEGKIYKACPLHWGYVDRGLGLWPGRPPIIRPTFIHQCKLNIPRSSPFHGFSEQFRDSSANITSYNIIATQTKCPQALNVHEFMAYQSLLSSDRSRWLHILAELGSFDLNFSTEATVQLIVHVSLQVGKTLSNDSYGAVHGVFKDVSFCSQLMEQLTWRMNAIACNWRESNCMEIIVTLLLRLLSLGPNSKQAAVSLLLKARAITLSWIDALQEECGKAPNVESEQRFSRYALWACLLCRRTFNIAVLNLDPLNDDSLAHYLRCTIALQDNMPTELKGVGVYLKMTVMRDLKMAHEIYGLLAESIIRSPYCLFSPLKNVLQSQEEVSANILPGVRFLPARKKYWLEITGNALGGTLQQTIHLHILEGHLLVMGEPIGKLPSAYSTAPIVEQLFKGQTLRTYTSYLPGMTYQISNTMNNHQIHVGSSDGVIFIRAVVENAILQLIPPMRFRGRFGFDLPAPLVDSCFHWLDLKTGIIDIRQESYMWHRKKFLHWQLNIRTLRAHRRPGQENEDTLINPDSNIFKRVAQIFSDFEDPQQLTVYQGKYKPLAVHIQRMSLLFSVNIRGWLECSQLQAEINENQDCGTWYGLRSKIVLTEVAVDPTTRRSEEVSNPTRKIIVSMGDLNVARHGPHVTVAAASTGIYGIFTINDVLGRLECGVEPRLLYRKALYHAFTSFPIPDNLTRRTGCEEALHCLQSAYCQPWTPLLPSQTEGLKLIAQLTPRRAYYPPHRKVMQKISWEPKLTTHVQHDGYRLIVASILEKSNDLLAFYPNTERLEPICDAGDTHLTERGRTRRAAQERLDVDLPQAYFVDDKVYESRHFFSAVAIKRNPVADIVPTIIRWPTELQIDFLLAKNLQGKELIGGYVGNFESALLTDLLDVELHAHWGSLVNLFCTIDHDEKYRLMFLAAVLAYSHRSQEEQELLKALLAFSFFQDLKHIKGHSRPGYTSYINFRHNESPTVESIIQLIKPHLKPYAGDHRSITEFKLSGKNIRRLEAAERSFLDKQAQDAKVLVTSILAQWPAEQVPTIRDLEIPILESIDDTREALLPEWTRLLQNLRHSQYLNQVHRVLAAHHQMGKNQETVADTVVAPAISVSSTRVRNIEIATLGELFCKSTFASVQEDYTNSSIVPDMSMALQPTASDLAITNALRASTLLEPEPLIVPQATQELQRIVDALIGTESAVRVQYGNDLGESLKAFMEQGHEPLPPQQLFDTDLQRAIFRSRSTIKEKLSVMQETVGNVSPSVAYWLRQGGLWPSITPITVLEVLRSTSSFVLTPGVKQQLIDYGLSITAVQRQLRMNDATRKGNGQKLAEEMSNAGHQGWDPLAYPDWLLLEIDSNILIRPIQVDVAMATISPASQANSVLQMNMGQGKTSCIMPMAAAVLADKASLVRLIVPKALLVQTAQLMHLRLGGLLGREIIHVPFSRKTRTSLPVLESFEGLHQNLKSSAGVVLALPEHLLSFQLSGQQQLSDGRVIEAQAMMNMQKWFTKHCRDIIDEADSILAIRTQLIYPSGTQQTLDGHPQRWTIIERILKQVESHLPYLKSEFSHSLELRQRPHRGLPVLSFLRSDVEEKLVSLLVDDVIQQRVHILPTDTSKTSRMLVKRFISDPALPKDFVREIQEAFSDKPTVLQAIHLLRGLFIYRILIMTLKKRWNVQYGLHPGREPIAVPFTAKGTPSEQAEWGHPDVAILFTCLSFYYDGLSVPQLKQTLEHVLKCDDASQQYDRFAENSTLPSSLRDWNAINVDDEVQLKDIWSHLRTATIAVDHYLNSYVFPKHAKQFSLKLQTSGWDIPLFDVDKAEPSATTNSKLMTKQCLTTGFSGTNDWKRMLPLTISQNDLSGLCHTNAEVLSYLLQDRNRLCVRAQDYIGKALNETQLLHAVFKYKIRVLIDAGSQILEMTNLELVKAWMEVDTKALAAVYFDDNNKACVYNRRGITVPFLASSFTDDLSECLVYLDEAHTRGTDFKLPINAIGAVTLGLGQTKDHTVQAAMRLRQLGTTQSVMFFAPPEVCHSIEDFLGLSNKDQLTSFDVVCWLVEQTCKGIEQLLPLYYAQGVDFCQRTQALIDNPNVDTDEGQREAYLGSVRQVEQQTLAQLYGAKKKTKVNPIGSKLIRQLASYKVELEDRRKAFEDSGQAVHGSALQEVEQERETQHEMEAVREVQKPIHYDALRFPGLHRDLLSFVKTGRMTADSAAYELAFDALGRTVLGKKFRIKSAPTSGKLFVSTEFTRTVRAMGLSLDHLQRPVKCILWSAVSSVAILVTPEEEELILPLLQNVVESPVHLMVYRAPVTRQMLRFNDLKFFSQPPLPDAWVAPVWLKIELGIICGRLYFEYSEYEDLCKFLGIRHKISSSGMHEIAHLDGIDEKDIEDCEEDVTESTAQLDIFTRKPLTFLQEWLAVVRKGQSFEQTPMGFVCQGRYLHSTHHFFANAKVEHQLEIPLTTTPVAAPIPAGVFEDLDDEIDRVGDTLRPEDYIVKKAMWAEFVEEFEGDPETDIGDDSEEYYEDE